MKPIKLPEGKAKSPEILSARVSKEHLNKWKIIKENNGKPIRACQLMEYMIDYFWEELKDKGDD
jgi:hypothetical protein